LGGFEKTWAVVHDEKPHTFVMRDRPRQLVKHARGIPRAHCS
jgi:hypothetical protein